MQTILARSSLTIAVLAALAAPPLHAQSVARIDSIQSIQTIGIGTIHLVPDRVVLGLTVRVRDTSAARAAQRNAELSQRLLDTLNAARQTTDSVSVTGLAVQPAEDRPRSLVLGYDAIAAVEFTLRDLTRISAILDIALRGGATEVRVLRYRSAREEAARTEALAIAYANARADAAAVARAAGYSLGPLLRASTTEDGQYISLAEERWSNVEITPQNIRVVARVSAAFRLDSRR